MAAHVSPVEELYIGRYVIEITGKARRKWNALSYWIDDEYEKMAKETLGAYQEHKDILLDPKSPFSTIKVSSNVFPESEQLTERGKEMIDIKWPKTTNGFYGRLPWYKHEKFEKYRFP